MTTAKTFDITDFDFLYEDEPDAFETEAAQESRPSYVGSHLAPSGKQKSERTVRQARQAVTGTARKAQEKGGELWKSTENVRKNTARVAREKGAKLWDSTADVRKGAKEAWNNSAQKIKEASATRDAGPMTASERRIKSFYTICGITAGLWIIQIILSFIPTIHMKVMDLISYTNGTFSLNTFWATDGGHEVDEAILIPIVMGILSVLSVWAFLLPMKKKNPEKLRLFILPKITALLGIPYAGIVKTMVSNANRRTYGMAGASSGFAPTLFEIICVLLIVLGFVASTKSRKIRKSCSKANAAPAEE